MNILLTNFHPGNGGGHTTYLNYLFKSFLSSEQIDNVYIAAPKKSRVNRDIKKTYPSKVFDIDFPGKLKDIVKIFDSAKKLEKIISKYGIDLVHVNGTPDHKVIMLCKLLYRLNFQIIRTKHDSSNIKINWFANFLYGRYTDHMIVVSRYQYNNVITEDLKKKTTVIHNGVDLKYYKYRIKSESLLKKYGICSDDIVFVSVAGSSLHKGWQILVEAASRLGPSERQKIKIFIAGLPPTKDTVDNYIKRVSMHKQVIFTGYLDDVRELISIADVGFVLSIGVETISFACREMMAMGKPVLVSNYAGLPENIVKMKNGWIADCNSIDNTWKVLNEILKSDLDYFSKNSISIAKKNFNLADFIMKTINTYSGVLKKT